MDINYYHKKLEQLLGYSFDEKDLSPSTRRMISEYKHYAEEMNRIEQTFKGVIVEEQKIDKAYSFWKAGNLISIFIGGIFLFFVISLLFPFLLLLFFILYPIAIYTQYKIMKNYRNALHRYYDIKRNFSPLLETIHNELSEVHRLKLRPETIEYKIIADFSFKGNVLSIKCPNCGANIDISKDKVEGNKYKCPYCQTTIVFPEKLLNLL